MILKYAHWDVANAAEFICCAKILQLLSMEGDWSTYGDMHMHIKLILYKQRMKKMSSSSVRLFTAHSVSMSLSPMIFLQY